ncbi:MAG: pre-peptidase C-terminal domain-containing protein [Bacillota bacterium]|nr:pre-peptidase C-terminal domain-containing protein [Bacillota bacterium]MDP4169675.1 pre-peptidase C-terminal domain-containing protein [Bacillota bacterium]
MRSIIYAVIVSLLSTFIISAHTPHAYASMSEATPILLNQHIPGTITDVAQKDFYKVSLPSDGNLHVAMKNVLNASWHMTVLDDKGNQLDDITTDKSATAENSEVQVGLTQGDYYIEVENSSNSTGVAYDLSTLFESSPYFEKENNDSLATATPISFDHPYKGNLSTINDQDYYKVVVEHDGNLSLSIQQQSNASWGGFIFNSKGEVLEYINNNKEIPLSASDNFTQIGVAKGTYYIQIVFQKESVHNPYTFSVGFTSSDFFEKELNDNVTSANQILLNQPYTGTINEYYDNDYFKFTLPADGNITFSMKQKPNASWYAYILDAKGEVYAWNWTESGQTPAENLDLTVGLPKGTYYIKISPYYFATDIPYQFTVKYTASPYYEKEFNNTLSSANPILLNQSYVGILQNGNDKDFYKVTVNQTGYVEFKMSNLAPGMSWINRILNSSGREIKRFTTGYSKGYTLFKTYLQKGTYYINVTDNGTTLTYPYELKVAQYSNPLAATQLTIKNNKNKADVIAISKAAKGDVIKVYNTKKQLISSKTSTGTSVSATVKQLGAAAGTIYVTVTHSGMLESDYTVKKFSKE